MTAHDRLMNAIGLCMKAGKCRSGDFIVERMLKRGELKLVIIDACVSGATGERYRFACEAKGVPLIAIADIGEAIGKSAHKIAGVTDAGFSNMILTAYEKANAETGGN
ncbi:MAG: ribosomal L7Ae/L30e/S12e/Gadd45 family protein [Clostridia bacterium]|nr:ribosomal L7Ae/L30e/S12e/Gadd45 family protein [Clostridia bacterium]